MLYEFVYPRLQRNPSVGQRFQKNKSERTKEKYDYSKQWTYTYNGRLIHSVLQHIWYR